MHKIEQFLFHSSNQTEHMSKTKEKKSMTFKNVIKIKPHARFKKLSMIDELQISFN